MATPIFRIELKAALDAMLLGLPNVRPGQMFGYPAYYAGGKMFACLYEEGVGIKLPVGLAADLIGREGIIPFQPLGRNVMKAWVQINRSQPTDYAADLDILTTAANHALTLSKG